MRMSVRAFWSTREGARVNETGLEETAARRSRALHHSHGRHCARLPRAVPAGLTATSSSDNSAPGTSQVDLLVATTRAPVIEPAGVMFGGARGKGLNFADIVVSVPPDTARKSGEIQWPSSPPGDPERDFVTLRADRVDLAEAKAEFNARVARTPGHKVLIFVHGYNTRFEEAVYNLPRSCTTRMSTSRRCCSHGRLAATSSIMSTIATAPCIPVTRSKRC